MDKSATPRRRTLIKRIALGIALCVALVGIATGVAAYRFFTDRPGERALNLVPSNALVFLSVDLSPSASQALVFKKIDDALTRNNLNRLVEKGFVDIFDQTNAVPELRELATRSGAFALLAPDDPSAKGSDPVVFILSLTDGARAEKALRQACKIKFYKGTQYYDLKSGQLIATVIDDQLVVAVDPRNLHMVRQVKIGERVGATSTPEYVAARASLDPDANLMVFVNPKMLQTMEPNNEQLAKVSGAVGWIAAGAAIRDGGISITMHGTMDSAKFASLKELADIKPIRSDLFKILPSGLYGASASTQQGSVVRFLMSTYEELANKREVADFEAEVQKNLGMDLRNDVCPNIQGNMVVGLYPSEGKEGGLDLLLVADDQNGADPSVLAETARAALDKAFQESEKKGPLMTKSETDGVWTLSTNVETEMQKGLSDAFSAKEVKGELLSSGKTVVYATEGKTVFVATSRALLDRAVATYKTGAGSAAEDVAYAQPAMIDASQGALVLNFSRIAKGVEATLNLDAMDADAGEVVKGMLGLFKGLDSPFYAKARLSSSNLGVSYFVPLDYDKLVDFIGAQIQKDKK